MSRIFLVDDHPVLLGGVRNMIKDEPGLEFCGQAASAAEAMSAIPAANPDLVIMDITLPDKSGLELIKDLLAIRPETLVLVFSMHDEMLYAERVIRAGGRGYLAKGSDSGQLIQAMRTVLDGGFSLSERVAAHILNRMSTGAKREALLGPAALTDRELEIFQFLGQGLNSQQIADKLHISSRTVDAHRNNIRLKLSLPDGASVIREAVIWVELGRGAEKVGE
jgi:DNA-binding NarL/FixJ family response regulator